MLTASVHSENKSDGHVQPQPVCTLNQICLCLTTEIDLNGEQIFLICSSGALFTKRSSPSDLEIKDFQWPV